MSGDAAPVVVESPAPTRLKLDDYLPHRLLVTSNLVSRLIARAYGPRFRLTMPQWRLIAWLADGGDTQDIAGVMQPQVVAQTGKALERRGLARRDGAGLRLTPEGRSLYEDIAPLVLAYEAALLTGLTPGEVTVLKHLLRRVDAAAARLSGEGG